MLRGNFSVCNRFVTAVYTLFCNRSAIDCTCIARLQLNQERNSYLNDFSDNKLTEVDVFNILRLPSFYRLVFLFFFCNYCIELCTYYIRLYSTSRYTRTLLSATFIFTNGSDIHVIVLQDGIVFQRQQLVEINLNSPTFEIFHAFFFC